MMKLENDIYNLSARMILKQSLKKYDKNFSKIPRSLRKEIVYGGEDIYNVDIESAILKIPEFHEHIANTLLKKQWRIFDIENLDIELVISDYPVIYLPPKNHDMLTGWSLGVKGVLIVFPLTKNKLILISDKTNLHSPSIEFVIPEKNSEFCTNLVKHLNTMSFILAENFIASDNKNMIEDSINQSKLDIYLEIWKYKPGYTSQAGKQGKHKGILWNMRF